MNYRPVSFALAVITLLLAGCQSSNEPLQQGKVTSQQEKDFQACLQENLAVSMDWEAVKQMCRERTSKPTSLLPKTN